MGVNRYKIEYVCECGRDYGNCGRKSVFYLNMHRSSDTYTIYHAAHIDNPVDIGDGEIKHELPSTFTDNSLHALGAIINSTGEEYMTVTREEAAQM